VVSLTPLAVLLVAVAGASLVRRTLRVGVGDFTSPQLTPLLEGARGGT
jgi:hypothetical protein